MLILEPDPRALDKVERFVAGMGFPTFAPRRRTVRREQVRRPRQKPQMVTTEKVQSLFGPYVLIRLPADETPFGRFADERAKAAGVLRFVRIMDEGPAIVPDHIVEELRAREAAGEFSDVVQHSRRSGGRSNNVVLQTKGLGGLEALIKAS